MSIDVFIPTKNSERTIIRCLDSILRANIPINRLIIVDSSDDDTVELINVFCHRNNINVLITFQGEDGVGYARQKGLNNIETLIYASIDSDVVLSDGWYDKIKDYMVLPDVIIASGFLYFGNRGNAIYRFNEWKKKMYVFHLTLGNCLINKKLLIELGGYNINHNSTEDTELYSRICLSNYKWILDRNIIAYNPRGLMEDLQHCYWYGKSYKEGVIRLIMRCGGSLLYGINLMISTGDYEMMLYLPFRMFVWAIGVLVGLVKDIDT